MQQRFRIETPDGRTVVVEAASEADAMRGAQEYMASLAPGSTFTGDDGQEQTIQERYLPGEEGYQTPEGFEDTFDEDLKALVRRPVAQSANPVEAFALGAAERIPFLDEAAAWTAGKLTGTPYEDVRQVSRDIAASDRENRPFARDLGGVAGFSTGFAIPGANWVKGAQGAGLFGQAARAGILGAGVGGVYGAADADGGMGERAVAARDGAALGGASGFGLQTASRGLFGSAAKARSNKTPQRVLAELGVDLTPGQMAGGTARRLENAFTSLPLVGDSIRNAQTRGIESFNRAAINRALEPIGERVARDAPMGREAILSANQRIGTAYDNALQGVTVDPSKGFSQGLEAARSRTLPGHLQASVTGLVDDFDSRFTSPISGDDFKQLESEINAAIRSANTGAAMDPAQRLVANRLTPLKEGMNEAFEAADPFAAIDKRAADEAYARMVRIQDAAQRQGTAGREGLFTPADLNAAVRGGDTSTRNRAYSEGRALMQDLTDPGMAVLPSNVPDTGTPLRSALIGGASMLSGAAAGQVGVPLANLATVGAATVGAGTMGLYSRPVMDALNKAYRSHSPGAVREGLAQLQSLAAQNPVLQELYTRAVRDRVRGDQVLLPAP